jgi:hypothetical protein
MSSRKKINAYLNVEKHKIGTKIPAKIVLDLDEYKTISELYGEEAGISEIDNVFELPGFFTIEFPTESDSIDFFLPYDIYLVKPTKVEKNKDQLILEFNAGDPVFYAQFKSEDTDIRVLKSLFENGVKYLGNKPDKLITAIWEQLMPSNTPWFHLEVIISQLYGTYDKKTKEILPLRLTNETYSKKHILNIKESAHSMNQTMPIMYGYSKDALRSMLQKKKRGKNSFFENIASGDYDELTKEYKK